MVGGETILYAQKSEKKQIKTVKAITNKIRNEEIFVKFLLYHLL